jgi:hypothetical protein
VEWRDEVPSTYIALGCLGLSLLPSTALANDPDLACQLAPTHLVVSSFGAKWHVLEHSSNGTDETIGSYTSNCDFLVYSKKLPQHGVRVIGPPPNYRVRKGFGEMTLSVTEQDDGPGGEAWNPDQVNHDLLAGFDATFNVVGGGQISDMPGFGLEDLHAFWVGNPKFDAEAYWRADDNGFIDMSLHCHQESVDHLKYLAERIVPHYHP